MRRAGCEHLFVQTLCYVVPINMGVTFPYINSLYFFPVKILFLLQVSKYSLSHFMVNYLLCNEIFKCMGQRSKEFTVTIL